MEYPLTRVGSGQNEDVFKGIIQTARWVEKVKYKLFNGNTVAAVDQIAMEVPQKKGVPNR